MESVPLSKKSASNIYCDHCQSFVGRSTYYGHRARYYNQREKRWECSQKGIAQSSNSESEEQSDEPQRTDDGQVTLYLSLLIR